MAITKGGKARKAGDIFDHAGTVPPAGAIALPIAQTNVSREAYAKLFLAIGTRWGAGDGVTTFGLPWLKPDHTLVQANGNVGESTAGQVIQHNHTVPMSVISVIRYPGGGGDTYPTYSNTNTSNTGGDANLAAGVRVLKCIQYA
ncbi:phage tail protein [Oxalicibacterium faecigallinarum]|uniref:Phage tail collar domain-containing protein n=1 Tax=Oxalicibacterium faecigallinarum TaxID=573741 RepID=A0A8J3AVD9_9BURK|nr:phage tail protein [Oxalicibacterium faecigallinarum]GGI16893.1 hypothetical protein GCM10008066_06240 [Oxalicibacterium faecigallinarum]